MKISVTDAAIRPYELGILCDAFIALSSTMQKSLSIKLDNISVYVEKPQLTIDDLYDEVVEEVCDTVMYAPDNCCD